MKNDQITGTACLLFRQKGTQGVSTQDIAAACGISKATLFKLFESKEILIEKVVEELLGKCQAMLANQVRFKTPQARMSCILDCSIAISELFPTIFYCSLKKYYQESFLALDRFIGNELTDSLVATLEMGRIQHVYDPGLNSPRVVQMFCWQLRLAVGDTTISEVDRPELYWQLKRFFISGITTSTAVV